MSMLNAAIDQYVQFLKKEEIDKCAELAEKLLSEYGDANDVPAWVVAAAVRSAFGYAEGTHQDTVKDLSEDVFTMMHDM